MGLARGQILQLLKNLVFYNMQLANLQFSNPRGCEEKKIYYYYFFILFLFLELWRVRSPPREFLLYVQYLAGCRGSSPSCCDRSQVCYQ